MKKVHYYLIILTVVLLIVLIPYSIKRIKRDNTVSTRQLSGQIYLYGEQHSVKAILDKEIELWCDYYENNNMRHLFVELPYYTAEFLNIWIQSDNDHILEELYNDWVGTSGHSLYVKDYYKEIKSKCPDTIFHGKNITMI